MNQPARIPDSAIASMLARLADCFVEDYGRPMSPRSISGFHHFLSSLSYHGHPTLAAESSGDIVATWRAGDETVSLKFLDQRRFHYALAIKRPDGVARPWGTADVFSFLAEYPEAQRIISNG